MAFMTPAEIRAVRLKGSKVVALDGLGKEVRIIKLASDAQLKSSELQAEVNAGRRKRSDTILFMLEHGLADLDGNPFTADDAATLFSLLSLDALKDLVNAISALIGEGMKVKVTEGTAEELTPAAKKD